tara:strand:- start:43 stop:1569 length:1527 start_codon:yes stop_codon:yes gene_type:complete
MDNSLKKEKDTISKIKNKNILMLTAVGITPHIETSLEICQRLVENNKLSYLHIGSLLPYSTLYSTNIIKKRIILGYNIMRANKYINKFLTQNLNMSLLNINKFQDISLRLSNKMKDIKDLDLNFIKSLSYKDYNIGEGIASTIVSVLQDCNPFPLSKKEERLVYKIYLSSIISIEIAENILDKEHYDTAILFNGRYACEYAMKQVYKKKDINIYYHERGWCENYFFFENYVPNDMSMRKKEILSLKKKFNQKDINRLGKKFFRRRRNGDGIGWISFNKKHLKGLSNSMKDTIHQKKSKGMKIISYFTSSEDEFIALEGIKPPFLTWGNQFEAIKQIAEICQELNLYLIIRSHPNLQYKSIKENLRWSKLKEEIKSKDFQWIDSFEKDSSYALVNTSDLIITGGSTIGVEAIAMGKPSLVISECHYDNIFKSILLCQDKSELSNILQDPTTYQPVEKDSVNLFGLWSISYGSKFLYFIPNGLFDGMMKNDYRINQIQKILKSSKAFLRR